MTRHYLELPEKKVKRDAISTDQLDKMPERLEKVWVPENVALSFAFAFLGAYVTITLGEQFRLTTKENRPKLLPKSILLTLMSCSLGGVAIWVMHQIGMQGMRLERHNGERIMMKYDIGYLMISLVAVLLTTYAGLWVASKDKMFTYDEAEHVNKYVVEIRTKKFSEISKIDSKMKFIFKTLFKDLHWIAIGGIITGTGVCVMHYLGLTSIVMDGTVEYQGGIVFLSVLIAAVTATVAYWILFRLLAVYPYIEALRLASSVIAMIATNGMHYTGMGAALYSYSEGKSKTAYHRLYADEPLVSEEMVAIVSIILAMAFLWLTTIAILADLRAWLYNASLTVKRCDELIHNSKIIFESMRNNSEKITGTIVTVDSILEDYHRIRDLEGNLALLKKGNILLTSTERNSSGTSLVHPVDEEMGAE